MTESSLKAALGRYSPMLPLFDGKLYIFAAAGVRLHCLTRNVLLYLEDAHDSFQYQLSKMAFCNIGIYFFKACIVAVFPDFR
jgi:hypothetical protein